MWKLTLGWYILTNYSLTNCPSSKTHNVIVNLYNIYIFELNFNMDNIANTLPINDMDKNYHVDGIN
jgi:hypothetical protein